MDFFKDTLLDIDTWFQIIVHVTILNDPKKSNFVFKLVHAIDYTFQNILRNKSTVWIDHTEKQTLGR